MQQTNLNGSAKSMKHSVFQSLMSIDAFEWLVDDTAVYTEHAIQEKCTSYICVRCQVWKWTVKPVAVIAKGQDRIRRL